MIDKKNFETARNEMIEIICRLERDSYNTSDEMRIRVIGVVFDELTRMVRRGDFKTVREILKNVERAIRSEKLGRA